MRPINKGNSPYNTIKSYPEALPYLEERIGLYCSYCELPIFHVPEVEHVVSKSRGGNRTEWDNLLLGCKYCNTRKGNAVGPENKETFLWPDENNTALVYSYEDGIATVYKGNIIKNLIMDCQSYTKYRPNETTGGIFVSWRRKEELPTGA